METQKSNSIDVLYVDGTFKSAPKFFHKLFTIHGLTMCNLHFFLPTNKHPKSYEDVFRPVLTSSVELVNTGTAPNASGVSSVSAG